MLFDIIYNVTLPVVVLILAGYVPQKFLHLDVRTLNRFVVYIMIPAFMVHILTTSKLSIGAMSLSIWLAVGQFFLLLLVGIVWVRLFLPGRDSRRMGAFAIAYPNSGNYGLPFIGLALGPQAVALQGIIGAMHGILIMSVGQQFLAGGGGAGFWRGVRAALLSPFTLSMLVGVAIKFSGVVVPRPLAYPIELIAQGFVPVAIMMLGVQLASSGFSRDWRAILVIVFGSLVLAPAVTLLGMVCLRWIGVAVDDLLFQLIVLNGGLPIGVLLAMFTQQWRGNVPLATSVVLLSTALSPVTLTAVLWVLRHGF